MSIRYPDAESLSVRLKYNAADSQQPLQIPSGYVILNILYAVERNDNGGNFVPCFIIPKRYLLIDLLFRVTGDYYRSRH